MLKILSAAVTLALLPALLAGCGNSNRGGYITAEQPRIGKDTKPEPQVSSISDEFSLAMNEFLWSRQSSALSLNPPRQTTTEGCVTRVPKTSVAPQTTKAVMTEAFNCKRLSDESDAQQSRRFELHGLHTYASTPGFFTMTGETTKKNYALSKDKDGNPVEALVTKGVVNRELEIVAPRSTLNGAASESLTDTLYKEKAVASYVGEVASGSLHQPETWQSVVSGTFTKTTDLPLAYSAGTKLSFSYTPETAPEVKRAPITLELVATTEVTFVLNGKCLRPVGTFNWTVSQGGVLKSGTAISTSTGFSRSDETSERAWGKRCLER